jgi:biopolymer transport protein ExbD
MKYLKWAVIILILALVGCGPSKEQEEKIKEMTAREANGVAKIKVDEFGKIYVNKKAATIEEMSQELSRIKNVNGVVWYHRSSSSAEAMATADVVIKKISEFKLPIKLIEKDFE